MVPGTESTNSCVWSTNGGMTSAKIPAKMPRPRISATSAPKNRGTPRFSSLSAASASGIAMMTVIRIATTRVRSCAEEQPEDEQRRREQHRSVERIDLPRRRHPIYFYPETG